MLSHSVAFTSFSHVYFINILDKSTTSYYCPHYLLYYVHKIFDTTAMFVDLISCIHKTNQTLSIQYDTKGYNQIYEIYVQMLTRLYLPYCFYVAIQSPSRSWRHVDDVQHCYLSYWRRWFAASNERFLLHLNYLHPC